jgi:hypothetical protein
MKQIDVKAITRDFTKSESKHFEKPTPNYEEQVENFGYRKALLDSQMFILQNIDYDKTDFLKNWGEWVEEQRKLKAV